jgi:hypothetical protein
VQRQTDRRNVLRVERRPERAQDVDPQDERPDLGENLDSVGGLARERFLCELDVGEQRSVQD